MTASERTFFNGLLCLVLAVGGSCKQQNIEQPPIVESKTIQLSLDISPEITDSQTTTQTQSKAPTADLVAVQIYRIDKGVLYPHARGIFTTTSLPQIDMIENQRYSIETTIITDGQTIIARRAADGAFYRPMVVGGQPEMISNAFKYTSTIHPNISVGKCDIVGGKPYTTYDRPILERYAGYSGEFTATQSTPIRITARRVYCAIRLHAEGLESGSIEVEVSGAPKIILDAAQNNSDTTITISLAGTTPASPIWTTDNYSESVKCKITHISTSGSKTEVTPSEGANLTLKRNYIHPIRINLNQPLTPSISIERGEMIVDEELVFSN